MSKKLVLLNGRVADQKVDGGGRDNSNDANLFVHVLGSVAVDDVGNLYRYVQNDSAGVIDQFDVLTYRNADTSDYLVTADISNGEQWRPAGVYGESLQIAVDEKFWVQFSGRALVNTETITAVIGDPMIAHATADGEADNGVNVTAEAEHVPKYMGVFLALETAGTPDTSPVQLRGLW